MMKVISSVKRKTKMVMCGKCNDKGWYREPDPARKGFTVDCPCGKTNLNDQDDFDIVLHTLSEKRDQLQKMLEGSMKFGLLDLMDQIRMEQIDQLDKAIKSYKGEHNET